jgi:hypothetical protein
MSAATCGAGLAADVPSRISPSGLTGFEVFKFTDGTVNNNDPLIDDLFYYSQYHDIDASEA